MSITLEPATRPLGNQAPPSTTSHTEAVTRVRSTMAASRLQFTWLGTTKSFTSDQKSLAASAFSAIGNSITAGKKLIDTQHEAYRELTRNNHENVSYWKSVRQAIPQAGFRLLRHDQVEAFNERLTGYRRELEIAARNLDNYFAELKSAARERLGSLYCDDDYPTTLTDAFQVSWEFPAVEPPDYLRELSPALYREQAQRISQRFEQAVEMAEQAFIDELNRLVNHLTERLQDDPEGRPKVFRDSAVANLQEFFQRFRSLNVRSSGELDELVARCEQIVTGVGPASLRDSASLRNQIGSQLSVVQSHLDQLVVERPRRNILRGQRTTAGDA